MTSGDGSAIAEFPEAVFADYEPQPQDVYDWIKIGSTPQYLIILAIQDEKGWAREGSPRYEELKWTLAENGEGFDKMKVKIALVGNAEKAKQYLGPLEVIGRRKVGVAIKEATDEEQWFLRRTVDNLFSEALARTLGRRTLPKTGADPDKLRRVAAEMKEVGRTGKEAKAGWRRAAELIELALVEVRRDRGAAERAEVLEELLEAQYALRDEQAALRTLAEFMATAPNSTKARTALGQLHLKSMELPTEALLYYRDALSRNSRHAPALIGEGDALTFIGAHTDAMRSYGRAGGNEGLLRRAASELRLGKLDRARGTAESLLSSDPSNMHATMIRACALYALGEELETARGAFEQVAASPEAQEIRAQACYNLGLTCARLGQHDAALAAFEACEKALQQGSRTGPTPDETVSPSLGRAFVAFCAGDDAALASNLDRARREAPRASYLEMFGGMVASLNANDASAVRALDAALRRAPEYGELDGWLGKTYLRLGRSAVATGASAKDSADTFERAVAFAGRAANREAGVDPDAFRARLRECLVRLGAEHLPAKERYTLALQAAQKVLDNNKLRENPPALALAAYCNFQLGAYDDKAYDECIRRFQDVLRIVPDDEEAPWSEWRAYSAEALDAVKHWRSLEEKLVKFDSPTLARDMEKDEKHGVKADIVEGSLHFRGEAADDGGPDDPTVAVWTKKLFTKDTFESVQMRISIPRTDRSGRATNNISFGVRVIGKGVRRGHKSGGKAPGIGVFYDRNKIAVQIGGGQEKKYKDGSQMRLDPEQLWPEGEDVLLRIEREDDKSGVIAVYLNDELVVKDQISAFKQGRGDATLWIGGAGDLTQPFDVRISDIRVVRKRK